MTSTGSSAVGESSVDLGIGNMLDEISDSFSERTCAEASDQAELGTVGDSIEKGQLNIEPECSRSDDRKDGRKPGQSTEQVERRNLQTDMQIGHIKLTFYMFCIRDECEQLINTRLGLPVYFCFVDLD